MRKIFSVQARRRDDGAAVGSGLESGSELGHEFYKKFGTGKLQSVNFKRVPADEAKNARQGFWRLDRAGRAPEPAKANGQDADAENESGEMDPSKGIFRLFLPSVDDGGKGAG